MLNLDSSSDDDEPEKPRQKVPVIERKQEKSKLYENAANLMKDDDESMVSKTSLKNTVTVVKEIISSSESSSSLGSVMNKQIGKTSQKSREVNKVENKLDTFSNDYQNEPKKTKKANSFAIGDKTQEIKLLSSSIATNDNVKDDQSVKTSSKGRIKSDEEEDSLMQVDEEKQPVIEVAEAASSHGLSSSQETKRNDHIGQIALALSASHQSATKPPDEFMRLLGIDACISNQQRRKSSIALRVEDLPPSDESPEATPMKASQPQVVDDSSSFSSRKSDD